MSTNDYQKLRECPFCGGEAKRSSETFERTILSWVYCPNCGAAGGYRHTEAEAVAAWNTRYHSEFEETVIKAWKEIKDYQERTCRWKYPQNVNGWVGYMVCSSCGEKYDETVTDSSHYCPNCGAKVVE